MRLISPRADYAIKYRYYRIRQKDSVWYSVNQYAVSVYELRLYSQPNQIGTEFALSGTGIAMDSYAGFPASYINNNNLSDRWSSLYTTSTYKWFGIDSGASAKYPLRSFAVYPYAHASGSQFPKYAGIEGSDDGTNWYCIGLIASSNITTSQWQYYNVSRAAWIEYVSGVNVQPASPRYLEISGSSSTSKTLYAIKVKATKVYFEITMQYAGGSGYNLLFKINDSGDFFSIHTGSYNRLSVAVDFDAGLFWTATNAPVDTSSSPNTFTYNNNFTIAVYGEYGAYSLWIATFNFGHYSDTPFIYAVPAGFERIQV